jgi:hypothetical protein
MTRVVKKAKDAGIFVVSSSLRDYSDGRFAFNGLGRHPHADPELFSSYSSGIFWTKSDRIFPNETGRENTLLVPMDSRCTASPSGKDEYVFYRQGGWSWSIPYIAGLYALACQVSPTVKPERFWTLALETADPLNIEKNGKTYCVGKIVNPIKLISRLKQPAS